MSNRLSVAFVGDAINDLTLVEKLSCTTEYGDGWWDDLDFAIVGPRGKLAHMRMLAGDRSVHECAEPQSQQSVYLFHHS